MNIPIEFKMVGFVPDPTVEYKYMNGSVATNFNYLQCVVLGNRIDEFLKFINDPDAIKQANMPNSIGNNALMLGISNINDIDKTLLEMLIPITDLYHRNNNSNTAILIAIRYAPNDFIKKLIEFDKKQLLLQNNDGINALMYYIKRNPKIDELFELLVKNSDLTQTMEDGHNILMISIFINATDENIKYIIEKINDKSYFHIKNKTGYNAMMYIFHNNRYEIAKILYKLDPDAYEDVDEDLMEFIHKIVCDINKEYKQRLLEINILKEVFTETKSGPLSKIASFL